MYVALNRRQHGVNMVRTWCEHGEDMGITKGG